tara:strand:- start:149 stop:646 length:498 start_codon:yes stop_codon:yes gene_type:complete
MRVFTLILLSFFILSVSAESLKIGYIDTELVVNNLKQYNDGKALIAEEFELKKQELLDLFNHIELLRANLSEIDQTLTEKDFQIELNKVLDLELSFKKETEYWQTAINNKQLDLLQKIEFIINNAIKEFALNENYDLILYENAAFVSDSINISNNIISKIENNSL